jgi:hypothetical protein
MYEKRLERLASTQVFARRVGRHAVTVAVLVVLSLAIGIAGYHGLEALPWVDAFLNAAMLMGGMGPVDTLHTTAGKLFASAYALYCGLVLLVAAGVLFAPVLHRLLHRFHLTTEHDSR